MACGTTIFGPGSQNIRIYNGDFVAIQGADTIERLIGSDLRIPYSQVMKGKVILKPGQSNYLLNNLGLGDNSTFLCLKATYDSKSVVETDNYLNWFYYDNLTKIYSMDQLLVLTGNSTNRVPQIYLTNPNTKYSVIIDVMVASIDDTYTYFNDSINQTGTSFTGLEYTDIKSYVVGESIVIYDKSTPVRPLIYILLSSINSIQISGQILIIDNSTNGTIFLQFLTEEDANQAHSLLNYITSNQNINIDSLNPVADLIPPIVYFYSNVGNTYSGDFIAFNGSTSSLPYDTSWGLTFSTSISLSQFGSASVIDNNLLYNLLISDIIDNRDGNMIMLSSDLYVSGPSGPVAMIATAGSYSLTFSFSDIAKNYLTGVNVELTINS